MLSILRKEVNLFFSSLIGYLAIGLFLIALGLFIWFFPETSILNNGFASLEQLFSIAPNIFLFLIPAITMRSFAEETQTGTFELLATRPVSDWAIILGKYFACFLLVFFTLLPTLVYFYSLHRLGDPIGNIDSGAVWGSYIGLLLLGAVFVAIGIFASSMTNNQIVAFILSLFLCFFFYLGFDFISKLDVFFGKNDAFVESIGINYHYNSISRGLVEFKDLVYFFTIIAAFLAMTKTVLEKRKW